MVSVRRGFLFLWVLGMGCVILLWHSLSLLYNYFGWDTLQKRRDLARLSMMYRIVHCLVDIPVTPYLTPSTRDLASTSVTRGHDSRFFQIRASNTTYQQSFSQEPSSCGTNSHRLQRARQRWRPSRTSRLLNATFFNRFYCCTYLFYLWCMGILHHIARLLKY